MCLHELKIESKNYVPFLQKEIEPQRLSIVTIDEKEKEYVINC